MKKYSRNERLRNHLLSSATDTEQTLVTSYFNIVSLKRMEEVITENEEEFKTFIPNMIVGMNTEKNPK